MDSSNPKISQDKKSHAPRTDSKCEEQTVRGKKHVTEPSIDDGVHDRRSKGPNTKVDDALRFLTSVFEEGGSSQSNKGIVYNAYNIF